MQRPLIVAIQGDQASFHEIAAYKYYSSPIQFVYCQSFAEVFEALNNHRVDRAFVAVSNSNHGEIEEVNRLISGDSISAEGEYLLPIEQHLLGLPTTKKDEIRILISHPVALSQCSVYVSHVPREVSIQEYYDTAAAARYVKRQGDSTVVAIGSEVAAKLYDLEIIEHSIQNDIDNSTLFKSFVLRT